MEDTGRIWEKVFGVKYCPIHFWTIREFSLGRTLIKPLCSRLVFFCCFSCPEKEACKENICSKFCSASREDFSLAEIEEAFENSSSYSEFASILHKKREQSKGNLESKEV